MSDRIGASAPSSSFFSASGTLKWSRVATRSATSASNSPPVTAMPSCVVCMSRPEYVHGPPVASQTWSTRLAFRRAMSVRANLPLIRESAAQRATKSSITAVIASLPPRRSYSVRLMEYLLRLVRRRPGTRPEPQRPRANLSLFPGSRGSVSGSARGRCLPGRLVEVLEEPMGGELDGLMAPLRCAVDAGDERRPMDALEVPEDERVAGLGLVAGAVGQAQVPPGVLVPGVGLQEGVLVVGGRGDFAPVAVEHVLAGVDELARVRHGASVERVRGHAGAPCCCQPLA